MAIRHGAHVEWSGGTLIGAYGYVQLMVETGDIVLGVRGATEFLVSIVFLGLGYSRVFTVTGRPHGYALAPVPCDIKGCRRSESNVGIEVTSASYPETNSGEAHPRLNYRDVESSIVSPVCDCHLFRRSTISLMRALWSERSNRLVSS